jgi:hypothetical protein
MLAIENAEEGCVKATFGAALAATQAEIARDGRVRRMMRAIAADELRHAALSWRLAAWLDARLDGEGRRAVARARRATVDALRRELESGARGVPALGLPDAARAREILEALAGLLAQGM